jgi:hypothetical protein
MVMGMERRGRLRALVADPRVLDAALVLGCLALTALAVKGSWSPLPRPAIAAAGAAGSLAQWPRRRWPQVAALLGAGATWCPATRAHCWSGCTAAQPLHHDAGCGSWR